MKFLENNESFQNRGGYSHSMSSIREVDKLLREMVGSLDAVA